MQNSFPVVVLSNGLKVANFSSPHPFTFDDGSVLPGCSPEMSRSLMLDAREEETRSECGRFSNINLSFDMSETVFEALESLSDLDVDIVLVPLPVMQAAKAWFNEIAPPSPRSPRYDDDDKRFFKGFSKLRTCRVADRVSKTVYHDKFCI